MLSLLSLLLASGTVLRADTELWLAESFPDPRSNNTICNTPEGSTLCDPDHLLTDQWRLTIHNNIIAQVNKLREADILYTDTAPDECHSNQTEGVQIFVILAKRIYTANNQSITDQDVTNFGNGIAEQYGLTTQPCKNYLLLIGVEQAKLAYTRTGSHLKVPSDLMQRIFTQYTNFFSEKNYMEGLNKIIDEIGQQLVDPFKDATETTTEEVASTEPAEQPVSLAEASPEASGKPLAPVWMYLVMVFAILIALCSLGVLAFTKYRQRSRYITDMSSHPPSEKQDDISRPRIFQNSSRIDMESRYNTGGRSVGSINSAIPYRKHRIESDSEEDEGKRRASERRSDTSSNSSAISLPRTARDSPPPRSGHYPDIDSIAASRTQSRANSCSPVPQPAEGDAGEMPPRLPLSPLATTAPHRKHTIESDTSLSTSSSSDEQGSSSSSSTSSEMSAESMRAKTLSTALRTDALDRASTTTLRSQAFSTQAVFSALDSPEHRHHARSPFHTVEEESDSATQL